MRYITGESQPHYTSTVHPLWGEIKGHLKLAVKLIQRHKFSKKATSKNKINPCYNSVSGRQVQWQNVQNNAQELRNLTAFQLHRKFENYYEREFRILLLQGFIKSSLT
jgi:hypothetical protein